MNYKLPKPANRKAEKQIPRKARNDGAAPDPRHHRLMVELDRMYRAHNDGLPLPNPGRVAKRLAQFLKANPSWPAEWLREAVWFRFASKGVNTAEDPFLWINRLPNYVKAPLDKWGKPMLDMADIEAEYWKSHPFEPKREDGKSWEEL